MVKDKRDEVKEEEIEITVEQEEDFTDDQKK